LPALSIKGREKSMRSVIDNGKAGVKNGMRGLADHPNQMTSES